MKLMGPGSYVGEGSLSKMGEFCYRYIIEGGPGGVDDVRSTGGRRDDTSFSERVDKYSGAF